MKQSVLKVVLLGCLVCLTPSSFSTGGEIGNPKVIELPLIGVALEYPSQWEPLILDHMLSIMSPPHLLAPGEGAFFQVMTRSLSLGGLAELQTYLKKEYGGLALEEHEFKGMEGFRMTRGASVLDVYWISSESVTFISYSLEKFAEQISAIYQSVRWLR